MAQKIIINDRRGAYIALGSYLISDLLARGLDFKSEEFRADLDEEEKILGRIEEKIKDSVSTVSTLLTKRVEALEKKIKELSTEIVEKVVVLKPITKKEARAKIIRLFKSSKILYYSDIVEKLGIDLPLVVEICDELEKEKIIGVAKK